MIVRVIPSLVALLLTVALAGVAQTPTAREDRIAIGSASLYVREIGHGPSFVVVHGGATSTTSTS